MVANENIFKNQRKVHACKSKEKLVHRSKKHKKKEIEVLKTRVQRRELSRLRLCADCKKQPVEKKEMLSGLTTLECL